MPKWLVTCEISTVQPEKLVVILDLHPTQDASHHQNILHFGRNAYLLDEEIPL